MMFSYRLKSLRIDMDLTQEQLAKQLNITRSALANYENGFREPGYEILIIMANYFDISLDYLLGRSDIPIPFSKRDK